jgi:glycosyltransferase involved in cell wall biosynthesis
VFERLRAQGFAGRDPYDALNATRLRWLLERTSATRRLTVQAVKRCPLPLQPLLGVPPGLSAYTLGHAMVACARLHEAGLLTDAPATAARLAAAAAGLATDRYGGLAWGSHFDVETRFGRWPRTLPNVVVTSYAAKGLAALAEAELADTRAQLRGASTFLVEGLPRLSDRSGRLICYTPETRTAIHNASLLAAGALCDMAAILDRPDLAREAESAAHYTAARQRADGSWPYAETASGQWIDGFHTGFVLEGLAKVTRQVANAELEATLDRGLAFYRTRLFGEDGEPFYSTTRRYPLDALSAAQGVETLALALDRDEANRDTLRLLLGWLDATMTRPQGAIAYQIWPRWTDWRQFPRWSLAPMASALAGVAAPAACEPTRRVAAADDRAATAGDRASTAGEPPEAGERERRLLMVVHSEYPLGETRVRRQAEAAVAAGWAVDVLALATAGRPSREVCDGVRVVRTAVRRERDMSRRGMLKEYGRFCLDALLFCLKAPSYPTVVVANPPDFLAFAALPLRLRGARVILDVHDLMTDLFAVRVASRPDGPQMRLLKLAERCSMRWADQVMTVHDPYAAEIRTRAGLTGAPLVVLNSADETYFARRSAPPPYPKVVMYHGSVFERYGVFDLLTAFSQVAEAEPEARLWLLGTGDAREELERRVEFGPVGERVELSQGFLPLEAIAERLARAHVGVVPNQPNELNRYALSTKLFEYVAAGVPVVCAGLPTIREYFSDDELLFFAPGNVADLSAGLRWALGHYDEMLAKAAAASERYERLYAWKLQKGVFLEALEPRPSEPGRRHLAPERKG